MLNIKSTAIAALLCSGALAATPAMAAELITDGSFETQGAASMNGNTGGYCYFGGTYAGKCAQGDWTGNLPTTGLQGENNGAFPGTQTPAGSYYAFIQSGYGTAGVIQQFLTVPTTGLYNISWLEAGRANGGGDQPYTVLMTPTSGVQTTIYTGSSSTNEAFTARSSGPTLLTAGKYTLSFNAQTSGGDNTAYIDQVSVGAVPEPATWGMMILGFGMIGLGLRSRRKAGAAVPQRI